MAPTKVRNPVSSTLGQPRILDTGPWIPEPALNRQQSLDLEELGVQDAGAGRAANGVVTQ